MYRSFLKAIMLLTALFLMLIFPEQTGLGTRSGLLLWYQSVVPSLFPFMVISSFIVSSGGISLLMDPIHMILKNILPLSPNGCYVLISGLICGFPMGAKTCGEFLKDDRISPLEGKFLMAVCNQPSPMFLMGFVYPLFRKQLNLFQFLFPFYFPLFLISIIAKHCYMNSNSGKSASNPNINMPLHDPISMDNAILNAVETLCKIGGYLILFSISIQMIKKLQVIPIPFRLGIIALMEMTTAVQEICHEFCFPTSYIVSMAVLAFGGLSGLFQVKSVMNLQISILEYKDIRHEKKAGLSIRPYFFWKIAQALLTMLCAWGLCNYAS